MATAVETTTKVIRIRKRAQSLSGQLHAGEACIIEMPSCQPTLHREVHQTRDLPAFTIELPQHYAAHKKYPLYVNIAGGDGGTGRCANLSHIYAVTGRKKYILVHLPLFQTAFDSASSPAEGLMLSLFDHTALAGNYGKMLDVIRRSLPNINNDHSCIGGFSNGAHATGILLSMRDQIVMPLFKNIILVEGGAYQMNDIFSPSYAHKNIIQMQGQYCYGAAGLNRNRCDEVYTSAQQFAVNLTRVLMWDVGHSVSVEQPQLLKKWLTAMRQGGAKALALRDHYEKEWQFRTGIQASVAGRGKQRKVTLSIANPFSENMHVHIAVSPQQGEDSASALWSCSPKKKTLRIPATARKNIVFQMTGSDMSQFPDIQLLRSQVNGQMGGQIGGQKDDQRADQEYSLASLLREAYEKTVKT